ncbi:aminotransferase class IV [Thermohalobacter berrensis]|uniref:Branched-chain amino acid aminotransferase n=1 Tax=Thermohalobacter berrensis TaxID=99594 RepID=A0A419T6A4_9FIRM|nr:aminotransferase class IV [Thermohalobacter berrensis]RKD32945.1 branched-chain amino acid aminotransferase [Thermohalobacter berrensis]
MKKEVVGNYYICNGEIYPLQNKEVLKGITSSSIYEVIRVVKGIPLFVEEHIKRMKRSAELLGSRLYRSDKDILKDILKLIKINNVNNLNIKLVCDGKYDKDQNFLIFFIKSYYPERELYKRGIHTILYKGKRKNPNIKSVNEEFKRKVKEKLKEKKAFEALLVDENNNITEGSRSNVFFVKGEKVYTAPSSKVLLGITRSHIVGICKKLGIEIIERPIAVEELDKFDGAFITGTSVNVLPITVIDNRKYTSVINPIISKISNEYVKEVKEYLIKERKKIKNIIKFEKTYC